MANEVAVKKKAGITSYLASDAVKNNIANVVGKEQTQTFIASVVSAVQTNPALAECTNPSILSAALLGESLKLTPSPQLGMYYMVPFKNKRKVENPETGKMETVEVKEATFQLGYKGYIQLAIRSGQYRKITVSEVKDGELIRFNPITEDIVFKPELDANKRSKLKTIGYYATFILINGFQKEIYWPMEEMENHAKTYSASYRSDLKYKSNSSFWSKNFSFMAMKTLIRQLISKYGVMSVEMQKAYENDMSVIDENGIPDFVDNKGDDFVDVVAQDIEENANQVEFDAEVVSEQ